jgi:serpin B
LNASGAKGGYQLTIANSLWGQKGFGFLPEFLKLTKDNYGACLEEVDFAADTEGSRKIINDWVEKATQEKIKELIPAGDLSTMTVLVLANAVYFKGDWMTKFKVAKTKDEPFQLTAEEKVNVPMMHQNGEFNYAEDGDVQVLEMPYIGSDLAMVIFLPRKVDVLPAMEERLTTEFLWEWLGRLENKEVMVALPRFKVTKSFRLEDDLVEMGMSDAFSPTADFSGMTKKKNIFIGTVLHKAFVEVNEEGTEAAAATAVVVKEELREFKLPPMFRADRPFFFLIRDLRSGSILFMGRISDPRS